VETSKRKTARVKRSKYGKWKQDSRKKSALEGKDSKVNDYQV
jgi:hypothetical protein